MMNLIVLIFLISCFFIWFYIKKNPNRRRRNISIITSIVSFLIIGTFNHTNTINKENARESDNITQVSNKNKKTTHNEKNVVKSETAKKPIKVKDETKKKTSKDKKSDNTNNNRENNKKESPSNPKPSYNEDPQKDVYTNSDAQGTIIGNSKSHIYHVPGQAGYHMNSANAVYFKSEQEAQANGYRRSLR